MKLTIEDMGNSGAGLRTMKISGFADGELAALKSIPNHEAKEALIDLLDEANGGIGSSWACGYGMYGLWFDNEAAYVNIGKGCD